MSACYVLCVCIWLKLRTSAYLHPRALQGLTQGALQEKLADHGAVTVTSYRARPGALMVCSECGREGLLLRENKISMLLSWVSTASTSLFSVGNSLPVCLAAVMMLCEIQICSDNGTVVSYLGSGMLLYQG